MFILFEGLNMKPEKMVGDDRLRRGYIAYLEKHSNAE
jgi:hypothetical protein